MKKRNGTTETSKFNSARRGEDENFPFNFAPTYTVVEAEDQNGSRRTTDTRRRRRPSNLLNHLVQNSRPESLLPYRQFFEKNAEAQKKKTPQILRPRTSTTKYKNVRLNTTFFSSPVLTVPPAPISREEVENMLLADVEHRPDVVPVLIGNTHPPPEMKQVRLKDTRETRGLLLPPKLSVEDGITYLGKRPTDLQITVPPFTPKKVELDDKMLFDWWRKRQGAQKQDRDAARLEKLVSGPLKTAIRELLTRVESELIQEHRAPQVHCTTSSFTSPSTVSSLVLPPPPGFPGGETEERGGIAGRQRSQHSSRGESALSGSRRGVELPLNALEWMFRQARAHVHETVVCLLEAYHLGKDVPSSSSSLSPKRKGSTFPTELFGQRIGGSHSGAELQKSLVSGKLEAANGLLLSGTNSRFCSRRGSTVSISPTGILLGTATTKRKESMAERLDEKSLLATLQTEKQLAIQAREDFLLPSCASLPPERVFAPCLALETAIGVATLWKILFQACPLIPGMSFGLHVYEHYILPHLYESFSSYASIIPTLGGLSEQVMQLTEIPLRMESNRLMHDTSAQCTADTQYLEYALKHFTFREWRRDVLRIRERAAHQECMIRYIHRIRNQRTLRAVFAAWRFESRESSNVNYLSRIQQQFQDVVMGKQGKEAPPSTTPKDGLHTRVERNGTTTRLIATRLAGAAARHRLRPMVKKIRTDTAPASSRKEKKEGSSVTSTQEKGLPTMPVLEGVGLPYVVMVESSHSTPTDAPPTSASPHPPPSATGEKEADARLSSLVESEKNASHDRVSIVSVPSSVVTSTSKLTTPDGKSPSKATPKDPLEARSPHMRVPLHEEPSSEGGTAVRRETSPLAKDACPRLPSDAARESVTRPGTGHTHIDGLLSSIRSSVSSLSFVEDVNGQEGDAQASRVYDLQLKAGRTFEEMLLRLQQTEEVCQYLRDEISVQSRMLRQVEKERDAVRARNTKLEEELLRVTEEKVLVANVVQEKQFMLQEKDRQITQLKSRLRTHRNRPWQKVVMRVVGEICGASTFQSEAIDDRRVRRDQKPDAAENFPAAVTRGVNWSHPSEADEEDGVPASDAVHAHHQEEEWLFGQLAPIVLSSTNNLPDAITILQDWANGCLDDLEELDDLKGGALSTRFTTFSEEARNGILLSRLLFYLSLPRYLQRTARRDDHKPQEVEPKLGNSYPDRRRQLLRKQNVQLDAPFPVFSECFGDLLSMRLSDRMALLLQFASELISGSDRLGNDSFEQERQELYKNLSMMTDIPLPTPAGRIELQEVIAPHALATGERASVVTFMALLYIRFAHPFHHKSKQCAEMEKAAMLHILSGGIHRYSPLSSHSHSSTTSGSGDAPDSAAPPPSVEEKIIMSLEDEDKSPWHLFKERCYPVFGSAAHPFLLRGNFWPSDAFDSPQLCQILGQLGIALHRSLELHRWHVLMSCLVPVMTYSGMSRGVFTGPRASPLALRVGLQSEGEWWVPLRCSALMKIYTQRGKVIQQGLLDGRIASEDVWEEGVEQEIRSVFSSECPSLRSTCSEDGAPTQASGVQGNPKDAEGAVETDPIVPPSPSLEENSLSMSTGVRGGPEFLPIPLLSPLASPPSHAGTTTMASSPSKTRKSPHPFSRMSLPQNPVKMLHALMEVDAQRLLRAVHLTSSDLLALFLRRSTLSAELALPTLNLGGWRLLCVDLKLLARIPEEEDQAPLSYDVASKIFFDAVLSLNEVAANKTEVATSAKAFPPFPPFPSTTSPLTPPSDKEEDTQDNFHASQTHRYRAAPAFPNLVYNPSSTGLPSVSLPNASASPLQCSMVSIPTVSEDMTFTAFVLAMVTVANALFFVPQESHKYSVKDGMGEESEMCRGSLSSTRTGLSARNSLMEKKKVPLIALTLSDITRKEKEESSTGERSGTSPRMTDLPDVWGNHEVGELLGTVGRQESGVPNANPRRQESTTSLNNISSFYSTQRSNDRSIWEASSPTNRGKKRPSRLHVGASGKRKSIARPTFIWLGECLEYFVLQFIPRVAGEVLSDESQAVINRLLMGVNTQEVLARFSTAIILVFDAYSKDVYGAAGMGKEDLLQLLRDAMLTSTEISSHLIYEVFQHCCVTRHQSEEDGAAKRREIDGRPRDARRRVPRSVMILDNRESRVKSPSDGMSTDGSAGYARGTANFRKDIDVLVYEGFIKFLCVLCTIKQPNPLIPFSQRLDTFLRRSVLRPLCSRVENLASVLNTFKTLPNHGALARSGTTVYSAVGRQGTTPRGND